MWTDEVEDLRGEPKRIRSMRTVTQAATATGYSPRTLMDALWREPVMSGPLSALARPAARDGRAPLYSVEQIEQAQRAASSAPPATSAGQQDLPSYTAAQAEQAGLRTWSAIAEAAGVHEYTARKWPQRYSDFPAPVGRTGKAVLFDGAAVDAWSASHEASTSDPGDEAVGEVGNNPSSTEAEGSSAKSGKSSAKSSKSTRRRGASG